MADLPPVVKGDPHVAAHNAERTAINGLKTLTESGRLSDTELSVSIALALATGDISALDAATQVSLRPWLTTLANRDNAKACAVCVGTSMTEGGPSTDMTSRTQRWTDRLQTLLRARLPLAAPVTGGTGYVPAFYQTFFGGGTGGGGNIAPVGVTYSAALSTFARAGAGLGNRSVELDSTGDWIEFAFTGTGCDVPISSRSVANSTATYSVDGAAAVAAPVPAAVTTGAVIKVRGLTAGAHTVRVTWGSGQVDVEGMTPYNGDEAKGIHVFDAGKGSATASNFTSPGNFRYLAELQPGLITIEFGYNEFFGDIPLATFTTNLQAVVASAKQYVTVAPTMAFIIWPEPYDVTPNAISYDQYANVVKSIAATTTNGIVIDFRSRIPVPSGTAAALALWDADRVHMVKKGQAAVADVLLALLTPR